jgi:hypothetical protein
VLCILRRADDVARAFVTGFACDAPVRHGFDPADAAVLAASLRMLAFLLLNMAAQASPGGTCGDSLLSFRRNAQPSQSRGGRKKANYPLRLARAPPRPPPRRCARRLPIFQKFNGQGRSGSVATVEHAPVNRGGSRSRPAAAPNPPLRSGGGGPRSGGGGGHMPSRSAGEQSERCGP